MNAALVTRINTAIIPTTPTAKHLATSFRPDSSARRAPRASDGERLHRIAKRSHQQHERHPGERKQNVRVVNVRLHRSRALENREVDHDDIAQSSNRGANTTTHPFTPDPIARATRYAAPLLAYAPSIDRAGASPENSHGIAVSTPKTSLAVTSVDWNHSSGCTYPDANAKTTRVRASEFTSTRFVAAIAGAGDARATEVGARDYARN